MAIKQILEEKGGIIAVIILILGGLGTVLFGDIATKTYVNDAINNAISPYLVVGAQFIPIDSINLKSVYSVYNALYVNSTNIYQNGQLCWDANDVITSKISTTEVIASTNMQMPIVNSSGTISIIPNADTGDHVIFTTLGDAVQFAVRDVDLHNYTMTWSDNYIVFTSGHGIGMQYTWNNIRTEDAHIRLFGDEPDTAGENYIDITHTGEGGTGQISTNTGDITLTTPTGKTIIISNITAAANNCLCTKGSGVIGSCNCASCTCA